MIVIKCVTDLSFVVFESVDKEFIEIANQDELSDGSCCILALIQSGVLTVANLGDSVCTLVKKDKSYYKLSSDHSPSRPDEKERVLK